MRRLVLATLALALVAIAMATSASAGGGNSAAAQACQKNGYTNLYRADHTGFRNAGDCVSYVAHGGVFGSAPG
jgi:hypothetical protein